MNYFEEKTFEKITADNIFSKGQNQFLGCTFKSIDFSNSSFRNQSFSESIFHNCNLSNIETISSAFRDIRFENCKMVGINWSSSNSFDRIIIIDSVINYSVFQNLKLKHFECIDSTANEVDFSEADLGSSNFSNTNLRQTSFHNCNLTKANFKGATEYAINPNFTRITKAQFDLPEAVALLEAFDIKLD